MFDKKHFKKFLSVILCLTLILSVMSGLSFSVSAADYNWAENWRYKTVEGGEWQTPASNKDVFSYYNGYGYFWADFCGYTPTDFSLGIGIGTGNHAGLQVNEGSTLIITASSFYNNDPTKPRVTDETKFWANTPDNNLMQTMGGTIIVGEGVWLEKVNGKSAISMENGPSSACYIAGRVTGSGWISAQGVWTKTGGSFHRLGRDNDNKNEGSGSNAMVYKDYYKGYLNMGDHVTGIDEGDYLFKGREFEPFLAQGDHYYLAGADHEISCEVEEGYHFTSWTGDATYNTQTANMNFSVSLSKDSVTTKTLTANAEINKYTVTFVSGATGETLKTQTEVPHGSAATAPTPANIVDVDNDATHKVFDQWDTAFDNITGNTTVTALYNDASHNYTITTHNASGHTLYCEACGHVKEGVAHSFDSYTGLCECGYESPDKADYTEVDAAIASAPRILV
ncbi:MAG: hypothetical protein IJU45_05965 [Clostridia bacterium]|nr:hypothetical protein [Clostridia bacterium]